MLTFSLPRSNLFLPADERVMGPSPAASPHTVPSSQRLTRMGGAGRDEKGERVVPLFPSLGKNFRFFSKPWKIRQSRGLLPASLRGSWPARIAQKEAGRDNFGVAACLLSRIFVLALTRLMSSRRDALQSAPYAYPRRLAHGRDFRESYPCPNDSFWRAAVSSQRHPRVGDRTLARWYQHRYSGRR